MLACEDRTQSLARRIRRSGFDPSTLGYGRFVQADPIGVADGLNLYRYAGNDPVNGTDPTGLMDVVPGYVHIPQDSGGLGFFSMGIMSQSPSGATFIRYGDSLGSAGLLGGMNGTGSSIPSLPGDIVVSAPRYNFGVVGPAIGAGGISSATVAQSTSDGSILESTRKGERGRAATNNGTPDPYKHMKPILGKPGFGQVKDPQTGKLSGPKPWPTDPRLGPQKSNYAGLLAVGAGIAIVGGIIFLPEFVIPGLIGGALAAQ